MNGTVLIVLFDDPHHQLDAFGGWLAHVVARLCFLPALRLLHATELLLNAERHVVFSRALPTPCAPTWCARSTRYPRATAW
jgi:hypothetical protein